jgi:hypothetical protein
VDGRRTELIEGSGGSQHTRDPYPDARLTLWQPRHPEIQHRAVEIGDRLVAERAVNSDERPSGHGSHVETVYMATCTIIHVLPRRVSEMTAPSGDRVKPDGRHGVVQIILSHGDPGAAAPDEQSGIDQLASAIALMRQRQTGDLRVSGPGYGGEQSAGIRINPG